jgi:hypothetical protein
MDTRTDGRTENIYSIFRDKLLLLGEHVYAHFASPIMMGEMISSYKRSMHDLELAVVWQTAFGKDFGGKGQGDNKMGQKGTNSVFVMTWKSIDAAKAAGHTWPYAPFVVTY